jgi:D-amino-acid dehydrogenase
MQRLAFYSRERLYQLTVGLQLDYDSSQGYLVLLRSEKDSRLIQPSLQVLRDAGVNFREVNAEEAKLIEPALNPETSLFGAVELPDDGVANCRQFALLLKMRAQQLGVQFAFNTRVVQLRRSHAASLLLAGEDHPRVFDRVVMCAGLASAQLLKPLGLNIPMVPIYGYSVSAPIGEPLNAPRGGLMDERYKVAISRLGQRVRIAGSAEIGGSLDKKRARAINTLYKVLQDWFPGAVQHTSPGPSIQEWKGARPMLPDGPPIIGDSGLSGLWLNIGHGSSGWALSCGSARALADLMAGKNAEVDMEGLGISRLL